MMRISLRAGGAALAATLIALGGCQAMFTFSPLSFLQVDPWELGIDTRSNVLYHTFYRPG